MTVLLVDATGTRRRLQALAAAGWPLAEVGRRLGWRRSRVRSAMCHRTVTLETAARVSAVYDDLWDKRYAPATFEDRRGAAISRAYARRAGWAPPMAWDDDEIDDPKGRPRGVRRMKAEAAA